jgi:hypothetical protein
MCFNYTKNWVDELSIGATSRIVNSNLRAVILQTTSDIYQRSLEDFGATIDSISAPLQAEVQKYCDLLYRISRQDYESDANSGGLTTLGSANLLTDLKTLLKIADDAKIHLLNERSTLVDCRIIRDSLRKIRKVGL